MRGYVTIAAAGFLLIAALAFTFGSHPASAQGGNPPLESRVNALERELVETQALLQETVAYLHAMAKSSAELTETLEQVEKLGFTAGINFKSREVLLAGLRKHLTDAVTDVPGVPIEEKPEPKR